MFTTKMDPDSSFGESPPNEDQDASQFASSNKQFPTFSELQQQTENSCTLPFLSHFDSEIDLSCLVSQLIPLAQLKSWQTQSTWNWSSLMAEVSDLLEPNSNLK
jgi:hypothetical protein